MTSLTKDLRAMSVPELQERLAEEQRDLTELRFKHAVTRLEQPAILGEKRRMIARLHTLITEKERA